MSDHFDTIQSMTRPLSPNPLQSNNVSINQSSLSQTFTTAAQSSNIQGLHDGASFHENNGNTYEGTINQEENSHAPVVSVGVAGGAYMGGFSPPTSEQGHTISDDHTDNGSHINDCSPDVREFQPSFSMDHLDAKNDRTSSSNEVEPSLRQSLRESSVQISSAENQLLPVSSHSLSSIAQSRRETAVVASYSLPTVRSSSFIGVTRRNGRPVLVGQIQEEDAQNGDHEGKRGSSDCRDESHPTSPGPSIQMLYRPPSARTRSKTNFQRSS
eukprot:TRINITY_DN11290_c0_g1_i1.p1 TRINITY_DN11290_c0_g1~~TRINITY_DN11290_c0_g1_i1.p1  ORF type:complete len:278 (+),score=32.69 TRINITY_DN11290_c0_g1_i1:27-836(+)